MWQTPGGGVFLHQTMYWLVEEVQLCIYVGGMYGVREVK